jgi:cell wall-associated NlpC family hydrolase
MDTTLPRALAVMAALLLAMVLVTSAAATALLGALAHITTAHPNAGAAPTPAATGDTTGGGGGGVAVADIPAELVPLYHQGATSCPGLSWTVLAAIGKIESDHGRSVLPGVRSGGNQAAGAMGMMQIIPSTWAAITTRHPIPDSPHPNPYNPHDSVFAAASLLCDNGAADPNTLRQALLSYNHASWYVDQVLAQAARYAGTDNHTAGPQAGEPAATPPLAPPVTGAGGTEPGTGSIAGSPPAPAQAAVAFARTQLGTAYRWGGNGGADGGFDCSGLTAAAYHSAGLTLPRTAQAQYQAGPHLPAGAAAQAGDLVFFGTPAHIHHVGIALGAGTTLMINAPDVGQTVRIQDWKSLPDLAGFTRPTTQ